MGVHQGGRCRSAAEEQGACRRRDAEQGRGRDYAAVCHTHAGLVEEGQDLPCVLLVRVLRLGFLNDEIGNLAAGSICRRTVAHGAGVIVDRRLFFLANVGHVLAQHVEITDAAYEILAYRSDACPCRAGDAADIVLTSRSSGPLLLLGYVIFLIVDPHLCVNKRFYLVGSVAGLLYDSLHIGGHGRRDQYAVTILGGIGVYVVLGQRLHDLSVLVAQLGKLVLVPGIALHFLRQIIVPLKLRQTLLCRRGAFYVCRCTAADEGAARVDHTRGRPAVRSQLLLPFNGGFLTLQVNAHQTVILRLRRCCFSRGRRFLLRRVVILPDLTRRHRGVAACAERLDVDDGSAADFRGRRQRGRFILRGFRSGSGTGGSSFTEICGLAGCEFHVLRDADVHAGLGLIRLRGFRFLKFSLAKCESVCHLFSLHHFHFTPVCDSAFRFTVANSESLRFALLMAFFTASMLL